MKFPYQKFPLSSEYDSRQPLIARPLVPIYLLGHGRKTRSPYYALLDSGADRVILPADLAAEIGIADFRTGRSEPTVGIAGQRADVYYNSLTLRLLGDPKDLATEVGFSDQLGLPILGRSFFRHFKAVVFAEPKEEVQFKNWSHPGAAIRILHGAQSGSLCRIVSHGKSLILRLCRGLDFQATGTIQVHENQGLLVSIASIMFWSGEFRVGNGKMRLLFIRLVKNGNLWFGIASGTFENLRCPVMQDWSATKKHVSRENLNLQISEKQMPARPVLAG